MDTDFKKVKLNIMSNTNLYLFVAITFSNYLLTIRKIQYFGYYIFQFRILWILDFLSIAYFNIRVVNELITSLAHQTMFMYLLCKSLYIDLQQHLQLSPVHAYAFDTTDIFKCIRKGT